jgi:hypothetical protein
MSDYFGAMGTALWTALSGGTALVAALGGTFIYAEQAPDGQVGSYVVFGNQGGGPENRTPREMRDNVWFVRAWADTPQEANRIDGLCEARLHGATLSVAGWSNIWCRRDLDAQQVDNLPNGGKKWMAGGMYRVRLSA